MHLSEASIAFIHPFHHSSHPSSPSIYPFVFWTCQSIHYTNPAQSAQHAQVARPTKVLLVSFLLSLFWYTYLYLSLFPLRIFRFFLPVVLFLPFLSFPVRVLLSLFLSFPSLLYSFCIYTFVVYFSMSLFSSRFSIPSLRVSRSGNTPTRRQQYFLLP